MTLTPAEREIVRRAVAGHFSRAYCDGIFKDYAPWLLAALEEAERERDASFLVLAAIIHSHGGVLLVPTRSLGLIPPRPAITREDRPDGIHFHLADTSAPEGEA